jgi:guanylate kinase
VRRRLPELEVSVSVTTRAPRALEREGVDYRFVSDDEFDRMIAAGELLEWAEIFGHRSGTPAEPVRSTLDEGRSVLLELDVQGARQIREAVPEAVLVLLEPPSIEELERRLRARGTESDEVLVRRLAKAEWELGERGMFDEVIVNDDAKEAARELAAIIEATPRHPKEGSADP